MVLTNQQREELNKAIVEYLVNNNYNDTATTFTNETNTTYEPATKSSLSDILEKKWISVSRLQKRIYELEARLEQQTEEMAGLTKLKKTNLSSSELEGLLPKLPAKFTMTGHRGVVTSLAFHPHFTIVASSSEDASVRLWDFETGQCDKMLKGHTGTVNSVSFDTTGAFLVSSSSDMTIKIWELNQNICIKTFNGHDHVATCAEFLPSNDFILSGSRDKTMKLWETSTGYCTKTFIGHDDWVTCISISADGKLFASGSKDQQILIWNSDKEKPILTLTDHSHIIEKVMFLNEDATKKLIRENVEIKKSHEKNGEEEEKDLSEKLKNKIEAMKLNKMAEINFSSIFYLLSASRDKSIKLWNVMTGVVLLNYNGHDNWVKGLALHHSGKLFYSCSDDKSIRVWEFTGKCIRKIDNAHNHFVTALVSNRKFLTLASGSVDNSIKTWELK